MLDRNLVATLGQPKPKTAHAGAFEGPACPKCNATRWLAVHHRALSTITIVCASCCSQVRVRLHEITTEDAYAPPAIA